MGGRKKGRWSMKPHGRRFAGRKCPGRCRALARIVLLLLSLLPFGASPTRGAEERELRVICYNVQFLPGIAAVKNKRGDAEYRAHEIGRQAAGFDVVGLQEVFDARAAERIAGELKSAWGESYHAVVHDAPDDGRASGGLFLASRLPILESHQWHFTPFKDPDKPRPDDFAAKGVLHARLALGPEAGGSFMDVFVTHLIAGNDEVRPVQYAELALFVRRHSDPDSPALIMGDMNTDGAPGGQDDPASRYHLLMTLLRDARPEAELVDVWPYLHGREIGATNNWHDKRKGKEKKRIDMIFLLRPEGRAGEIEPTAAAVNRYEDAKVGSLSDHSAVEAVFSVTGAR